MRPRLGYVEEMKAIHLKRPAFVLLLCGSAALAAVGVFALSGETRAQPALTLPAPCTCSKAVSLADAGQIINCRCETLQCVFAVATTSPSQSPALVCVK